MRRDSFRPSVNGFRFADSFGETGAAFGLGAELLPTFGLGAGMAWVALDRFLAGRPVPSATEAPAASDPLFAEITMRQVHALTAAPWSRLVEWQCLPERGLPGRPGLTPWSRMHWRRARQSLDAGMPMLLFLVLANGRHANPSSNKPVLAVGYDIDHGERRVTVLVYDPHRPGHDSMRLVFRTGPMDPLDARFGGDTVVRGFFTVPYDRSAPHSLTFGMIEDAAAGSVEAVLHVMSNDEADGPVTMLARSLDGGLVQIRRRRSGRWAAEHVQNKTQMPIVAAAGAVAPVKPGRLLARTANGDLLHLRRLPLLGWRARNITRPRRGADNVRIDGDPAVLRTSGGITVVACAGGRLVRYRTNIVGRWKADVLATERLARTTFVGTPALAEQDSIHVLCRTETGALMHLREDHDAGWTATNVTIRAGGLTRVELTDDPILVNDRAGGMLSAVTRSKNGAVLLFRWMDEGGWSSIDLTASARPPSHVLPAASRLSAVVDDEGTVHVAARDAEDGLIHLWCTHSGAAGGGRVAVAPSALAHGGNISGSPVIAVGPEGGVHVFARRERELLLFRWTPVCGWTLENLTRERRSLGRFEPACDPVLSSDEYTMHIGFADEAGRIHHACASIWKPARWRLRRTERVSDRTAASNTPAIPGTHEQPVDSARDIADRLLEATSPASSAPPVTAVIPAAIPAPHPAAPARAAASAVPTGRRHGELKLQRIFTLVEEDPGLLLEPR